ncbi:MerR family transcriptional regulator [Isoptericola halotolerans]|uniref:helix-turn-helix domain-containing protein n=1 Tax=Isoptericola halotolerans TaxID=300560 RepID=UPI0038902EF5
MTHPARGLTISQAAAFACVTVKTVRHYHRQGLVEEPGRDRSGYRRYGSEDLLRLVQVRTLATAGVPLAEIAPMLDADPERFAAALDDVERRLSDQIDDLAARRDNLHRLAGDRALLPDRACAVLERLPELGFRPEYIAGQREALVLVRALIPEGFDGFLAQLELRLADARFVELTRCGVEAEAWALDDPRIEELASAMADHFLNRPDLLGDPRTRSMQAWSRASIRYQLINNHRERQSPVAARLTALTEGRLRDAGVPIPFD